MGEYDQKGGGGQRGTDKLGIVFVTVSNSNEAIHAAQQCLKSIT